MTENYSNALVKSGVGVESASYGTAATSFAMPGVLQENTFNVSNVVVKSRSQNGSRDATRLDVIQQLRKGKLTWKVIDGTMFLAAYGSISTSGAGSPYTHTFTTGSSIPSFSTYKEIAGRGGLSDHIRIFKGCKINKFTLKCQEGGHLMAEAECLSNDDENSTSKAVTTSTTAPYRFSDITSGNVSMDGEDVKIVSYEHSRDNKLTEEQEGETIAEPSPQEADDTLKSTVKMKSTTVETLKRNKSEFDYIIKWAKSTDLYIQLTHRVVIRDAPIDTGVEGEIEIPIEFDVKNTTVEIKDSNSSYTL